MAINYTWNIAQLDCCPAEGDLTNVIKTIHWRLNAVDSTDNLFAGAYGSVGLESPDAETFIDYEDLTQTQIESWLESKLEVQNLKDGLAGNIEKQRNPPIVALTPPWS